MNAKRRTTKTAPPAKEQVESVGHALCRRVRELRNKKGWTLEELSAACSVSRSMLSEIERGRANPMDVQEHQIGRLRLRSAQRHGGAARGRSRLYSAEASISVSTWRFAPVVSSTMRMLKGGMISFSFNVVSCARIRVSRMAVPGRAPLPKRSA